MFGRHSGTAVADRDTAADERTATVDTPAATDDTAGASDTTLRRPTLAERIVKRDNRMVEPATGPAVADAPETERAVTDAPVIDEQDEEARAAKRWTHVSVMATLSLLIGVLAVAATLTGLLAPIGFAGGVLAVLLGALATYAVSRPHVTGHGLVTFGVLCGAAAIILSLLAINGQLSWLSSDTNTITTVHNWLNDHIHWMRRW